MGLKDAEVQLISLLSGRNGRSFAAMADASILVEMQFSDCGEAEGFEQKIVRAGCKYLPIRDRLGNRVLLCEVVSTLGAAVLSRVKQRTA